MASNLNWATCAADVAIRVQVLWKGTDWLSPPIYMNPIGLDLMSHVRLNGLSGLSVALGGVTFLVRIRHWHRLRFRSETKYRFCCLLTVRLPY